MDEWLTYNDEELDRIRKSKIAGSIIFIICSIVLLLSYYLEFPRYKYHFLLLLLIFIILTIVATIIILSFYTHKIKLIDGGFSYKTITKVTSKNWNEVKEFKIKGNWIKVSFVNGGFILIPGIQTSIGKIINDAYENVIN